MAPDQFENLIERLARETTRREAVKGLVGGAIASAGVTTVAAAKGKKGRGGKNDDNGAKNSGKSGKKDDKGDKDRGKAGKNDAKGKKNRGKGGKKKRQNAAKDAYS